MAFWRKLIKVRASGTRCEIEAEGQRKRSWGPQTPVRASVALAWRADEPPLLIVGC